MTLPAEAASVPAARRFVSRALEPLGADDAAFNAALLVSELVTNGVLHARTPVTVGVDVTDDTIRVTVSDGSPAGLRQRRHAPDAGTGRGLMLVERLALRWGIDPRRDGKTVWFELSASPARSDDLARHRG